MDSRWAGKTALSYNLSPTAGAKYAAEITSTEPSLFSLTLY